MALTTGQLLAKKFYRASLISQTILGEIKAGRVRQGCEYILKAGWLALASCAPVLHRLTRKPNAEETLAFDRTFGVETSEPVRISEMNIAQTDSVVQASYYQASSPTLVRQAINALGPIRHEDFTFVDCGSGKGLVLLLASEFAFRRIVGIEFAADLHEKAMGNIRAFNNPAQRCRQIESVCADATTFGWPADPMLFYLYNPFGRDVLEGFLDSIEASWREHRREVWFIYVEPLLRDCFDRRDWLQLHCELKTIQTRSYRVYRAA